MFFNCLQNSLYIYVIRETIITRYSNQAGKKKLSIMLTNNRGKCEKGAVVQTSKATPTGVSS